MIEELARVKECFKKVNKEISFWNFCKKKPLFCCGELLILIFFILLPVKEHIWLFLILLIGFYILVYFHLKLFRDYLFSSENISEIKGYSEYWLDFKYQELKKCIEDKIENLNSTKIRDYIHILNDEYKSKQVSFIERNPVFSISFAVFIAIVSSGIMDKGSDLKLMAFLFLLSIVGMIISIPIHSLFSFTNEKQLIFLLTLLEKELNNNQNNEG